MQRNAAQMQSILAHLHGCLGVAILPLPSMLDLDRLDDGSLDLRQRFFSGSFYSSRLEEAYKEYLQSIWVPRIRALSLAVIVWEMIAMIDSFACHCGVRVGTYEGWALVWSLSFPTAVSLLTLVVLSPFFSQFKRYMPLNVVVLVVLYCVTRRYPGDRLVHSPCTYSK